MSGRHAGPSLLGSTRACLEDIDRGHPKCEPTHAWPRMRRFWTRLGSTPEDRRVFGATSSPQGKNILAASVTIFWLEARRAPSVACWCFCRVSAWTLLLLLRCTVSFYWKTRHATHGHLTFVQRLHICVTVAQFLSVAHAPSSVSVAQLLLSLTSACLVCSVSFCD